MEQGGEQGACQKKGEESLFSPAHGVGKQWPSLGRPGETSLRELNREGSRRKKKKEKRETDFPLSNQGKSGTGATLGQFGHGPATKQTNARMKERCHHLELGKKGPYTVGDRKQPESPG